MQLFFLFKRLLLSILLIVIAAFILLYSDLSNRSPSPQSNYSVDRIQPGKIYRIGIAYFAPEEGIENVFKGLFDGLREKGFVKDKNLQVIMKHANGEIAMFPSILQSLDNEDVQIVMPMTTPCITAACNSLKKKKAVFTYCYDPIAAGAGKSFIEHLPNMTGVGSFPPVEKTVEVIQKLIPGIKTVGTIYNSSEANSRKVISVAREIYKQKGINLVEMTVTNTNEVIQAAQVLVSKDIQAIWITGDNTCIQAMDGISVTASKHKLPLIINDPEYIPKGALIAVGVSWYDAGYKTSEIVSKVLLGGDTKDIPIINFAPEKIVLNDSMAKRLNITFPSEIIEMSKKSLISKPVFAKKPKLFLMEYVESPNSDDCIRGVLEGLENAGLKKDKDCDITIRNAQGDIATLSNIIDAAISSRSDLIFSLSTPPLQSAVKKIKNVPIVFTNSADPVAAGAGVSFTNHNPNITGISTMSDFEGMIKLVRKVIPYAKRIGTLFTPSEINSVIYKDKLQAEAAKNGLILESVAVYSSSDVPNAIQVLCSKNLDAVCQISDNLNNAAFSSIANTVQKSKKIMFTFTTNPPRKNLALGAVARDYYICGSDAAALAIRILKGENPKNIPFSFARKTLTILNKNVAKKLGINLPADALKSADEIIGD